MTKKTIYLLGIVITILIGMWLQHHFCCSEGCCEQKCSDEQTTTVVDDSPLETLSFLPGFRFNADGGSFSCNDNFKFLNADFKLITPVSDSINLGIEKLKSILENSDTKFSVIGNYNPEEGNNSVFPDLGLARATAVKNYLVSKGIDESRLMAVSRQNTSLSINDTIFSSTELALWIDAPQSDTSEEVDWNKIKAEINANPVRVYFKTGESTINLTQEQKVKIKSIIDYVMNVPNSKISVVGHTDNVVGATISNLEYSKKRAAFVKDYLVSNGISESSIVAEGKGETQPIASNDTEEGRATNRRVEILIQ